MGLTLKYWQQMLHMDSQDFVKLVTFVTIRMLSLIVGQESKAVSEDRMLFVSQRERERERAENSDNRMHELAKERCSDVQEDTVICDFVGGGFVTRNMNDIERNTRILVFVKGIKQAWRGGNYEFGEPGK